MLERTNVPQPRADDLAIETLIPLRSGEGESSNSYEIRILIRPPNAGSGRTSESASVSQDGISAFATRVANKLTLSTWLPAALFALSVDVLLQFRNAGAVNASSAAKAFDPVQVLIVAIPLFVIVAAMTNAFSFEMIRTLEGYWRGRGIVSLARMLMIQKHARRKKAITARRHKVFEKAFYITKPRMLRNGISSSIVNALEAQVLGKEPPSLSNEEQDRLARMDWQLLCDSWHFAVIDHLLNEELTYPVNSRILPTRLGNLIRATEDRLQNASGDLQGFVLRRHFMVPRRVQLQHDQFRNRLGMYCSLVFVSAALAGLTPIILLQSGISVGMMAVIFASFAALGAASYLAAMASAAGYCMALRQMDEASRPGDKG